MNDIYAKATIPEPGEFFDSFSLSKELEKQGYAVEHHVLASWFTGATCEMRITSETEQTRILYESGDAGTMALKVTLEKEQSVIAQFACFLKKTASRLREQEDTGLMEIKTDGFCTFFNRVLEEIKEWLRDEHLIDETD